MASTKTSMHTTIPRFTVQDGYQVLVMDVQDTGRLAVAGYNDKTRCTFIDLFMLQLDADSQEKPLLLTPEPYYSEEFTEFGPSWRSVCLLCDSLFLTCCKDTIAMYDSSNGGLVYPVKLNNNCKAWCMTTRDGLVYVGIEESNKVIVLDWIEMKVNKTITLTGLVGVDWPGDITVSNNKLFICTVSGRAIMYNSEGEIEQKYTNTQFRYASSITVSEEKGLIFILWGDGDGGGSQVVCYTISGGHSSISGGHSSISGCHSLASFKVPDNSRRIRINNNINRLFLATQGTGEVYEYHTSDIFSFDNLLMRSESLIGNDDCKKLLDYFEVPAKNSKDITKSDTPFSSLVHHLREAGKVSFDDINHLMTACSEKGLSKLMTVLNVYQQAQDSKFTKKVLKDQLKTSEDKRQELPHKLTESEDEERQELTERLKTTEEERQQLKDTLKATEEERQQLSQRLKTTEEERRHFKDTLKETEEEIQQMLERLKTSVEERQQLKETLKTTEEERQQFKDALKATYKDFRHTLKDGKEELLQQQKEELEEAKSSLRATKDELVKSQLEYAKESMALQEVLKQTREALNQQALEGWQK